MFQLPELPPMEPRYNVAASQDVLAVRRHPAAVVARDAAMLRWGLIPSWATDVNIGSRLINARSETAAEKPAFRERQDTQIQGEWKRLLVEARDSHWVMAYGDWMQELTYAANKIGIKWVTLTPSV